jgi:hypothetical protein
LQATLAWTLQRDPFGKLVLTTAQGERFEGVVPVRAFPVQSPEDGIALVSTDGKEAVWIDHLADAARARAQLDCQSWPDARVHAGDQHIVSVTSFSTPCTWTVETDRGDTQFVLRGDEDIRRIGTDGALLVADIHGIQYLIRNQYALDATSKKILDRFL